MVALIAEVNTHFGTVARVVHVLQVRSERCTQRTQDEFLLHTGLYIGSGFRPEQGNSRMSIAESAQFR